MVSGLKDCITQEMSDGMEMEKVSGFKVCGKSLYNPEKELCCNGTKIKKTSPYDQCCGLKVFNSFKQACCAGVILEKSSLIDKCCSKTLYNPKELCCNRGAIVPINQCFVSPIEILE